MLHLDYPNCEHDLYQTVNVVMLRIMEENSVIVNKIIGAAEHQNLSALIGGDSDHLLFRCAEQLLVNE